jgi:hypothetical protein
MLFGNFVMKEQGWKEKVQLAWISGEGFVPGTFPYLCHTRKKSE